MTIREIIKTRSNTYAIENAIVRYVLDLRNDFSNYIPIECFEIDYKLTSKANGIWKIQVKINKLNNYLMKL